MVVKVCFSRPKLFKIIFSFLGQKNTFKNIYHTLEDFSKFNWPFKSTVMHKKKRIISVFLTNQKTKNFWFSTSWCVGNGSGNGWPILIWTTVIKVFVCQIRFFCCSRRHNTESYLIRTSSKERYQELWRTFQSKKCIFTGWTEVVRYKIKIVVKLIFLFL